MKRSSTTTYLTLGLTFLVLGVFGIVTGCSRIQPATETQITTTQLDPQLVFDSEVNSLGSDLQQNSDELILKNRLQDEVAIVASQAFYYPMVDYQQHISRKAFGQFIPDDGTDRFTGYHTGDDIEVSDVTAEVPVYAITDALVTSKQYVSGYGGVVIIEFEDAEGDVYHALYGHVDLASVPFEVGESVARGDQLAVLGDHESAETDGERKHLHFGIYAYASTELYAGYVQDDADLVAWENPSQFLRDRYAQAPVANLEADISAAINSIINETQQ